MHDDSTWLQFVVEVIVAALLVAFIDWCERKVDGAAETNTVLVWSVRVLLFEIFVLSAHNLVSDPESRAIIDVWGHGLGFAKSMMVRISSCIVLTLLFFRVVLGRAKTRRQQVLIGVTQGALTGIVAFLVESWLESAGSASIASPHPASILVAYVLPGALLPWMNAKQALPPSSARLIRLIAVLLCVETAAFYLFQVGWKHEDFSKPVLLLTLIAVAILTWTARRVEATGLKTPAAIQKYWPLVAASTAICAVVLTWPWVELGPTTQSGVLGRPEVTVSADGGGNSPRGQDQEPPAERAKDAVLAQLCVSGSLCFWLSVGLLTAWSIHDEPALSKGGIPWGWRRQERQRVSAGTPSLASQDPLSVSDENPEQG